MHGLIRNTVLATAVLVAGAAQAAVTTYQGATGLADFNTAAGNPATAITFESLSGDIAGQTHSGVTFNSPGGINTLDVVVAADTFTDGGDFTGIIDADTNKLFATSGRRVLSPGGTDLVAGPDARETDGLELVFDDPLSAFGLDVLFQSYDCCTFMSFAVYNAANGLLASGSLNGNGGGGGLPAGALFFGVFSDAGDIKRIVFTDTDNNNSFPDSNVGYDTFRFGAAIPEPATWALMIAGFGLAGGVLRTRRREVRASA